MLQGVDYTYFEPSVPFVFPGDSPEEVNFYREASCKFIGIMSLAMTYVVMSDNPVAAAYGVVYGLGLSSVTDKNMSETAREIGVSRASISRHATDFCAVCDLPPSLLMKREEMAEKARNARCGNLD